MYNGECVGGPHHVAIAKTERVRPSYYVARLDPDDINLLETLPGWRN